MPSGTELNGVFAPRIHKANARSVSSEAEETLRWVTSRLLVLASCTPSQGALEGLVQEVDSLVDDVVYHAWRLWAADYINENPEDCNDELDNDQ